MILLIGNTKGGVGKTTLALNVAIARAITGRDVWLIDGDRQGTATAALAARSEAGRTPGVAVAQYPDGPTLRAQLLHQRAKFDDVVIDAGGRDSTALRAALALADTVLIPFAPRSFDVWALSDMATLVEEARSVRDGLRALAVLNFADPAGSDNTDAAAACPAPLTYLATPLVRRKAFATASADGLCVHESRPRDPKACDELTALLTACF